jgi:hypothetical protein
MTMPEFIQVFVIICVLAVPALLVYLFRPTNRANLWVNIPGRNSLGQSGRGGQFTTQPGPLPPDPAPGLGDDLGPFRPSVNPDVTCKLTGRRVGDCGCDQCRKAKGEGPPL